MSTITTIQSSDLITDSRADINNNFSALNNDKIETSYLDTDTSLTANSDTKIATQKAVKAYVDSGGQQNASETVRGLVEEATDAEVTAGTATGGTGAKLVVTPTKLLTYLDSKKGVTATFTAGENITAGNAVYMSSGEIYNNSISTLTTASTTVNNTNWVAQTFVTSAYAKYITSVDFYQNDSDSGTWTVSIRAVSGDAPTGTDLVSGTVSGGSAGGKTVTFASPLAVSPSTAYAIVARTGGTTLLDFARSSSNPYANGRLLTSADSGANWSGTSYDAYLVVKERYIESGSIGKTVDGADTRATAFIGFAETNITSAATGKVILAGAVTGLSGLSVGTTVYLSATPGALASSGTKKVGLALSATELLIKNDN
jgi:hypothetical protein